jgi:LAO/AO transport system kinase
VSAVELAAGVRAGDRRALSRAITLIESRRRDDAQAAESLLAELYSGTRRALRVGVTGAPGAGKSTLLDALGALGLKRGRQVGVLAVDPTSRQRGGSVLGDRLRMTRLASAERAFVRASPSGGAEGGLGRRTREALVLLEAAGFDLIFLESVGVGQNELSIVDVVDVVLLVLLAGAGDEVQGMKRGLLEHADLVVFNKSDGARASDAERARDELSSLFAWMRAEPTPVFSASALENRGTDELFDGIERRARALEQSGELERRRAAQRRSWFRAAIEERVLMRTDIDAELHLARRELERAVDAGQLAPPIAARQLLDSAAGKSSGGA